MGIKVAVRHVQTALSELTQDLKTPSLSLPALASYSLSDLIWRLTLGIDARFISDMTRDMVPCRHSPLAATQGNQAL